MGKKDVALRIAEMDLDDDETRPSGVSGKGLKYMDQLVCNFQLNVGMLAY